MKLWVTRLTVLVESKKLFISTKKIFSYLVLAYKQYHYKCSVHISAPQVKDLGTTAHSYPNSRGGRNTATSPHSLASINRKENPFTKTTDDTKKWTDCEGFCFCFQRHVSQTSTPPLDSIKGFFPPPHVLLETFDQKMHSKIKNKTTTKKKTWLFLRILPNINMTFTSVHVVHYILRRDMLIISWDL